MHAEPEAEIAVVRTVAPREEQRMVLIIDLVGSTGIAERLGSVRCYAFLSDVFARLSRVIASHGGEVHRTVGDALIATWPLGDPLENARAIQSVFAGRRALAEDTCGLLRRHGVAPAFRAALHAGPLVVAGFGGLGHEPDLVGDALNSAARIEEACRAAGEEALVSQSVLEHVALPDDIVATSLGRHALRGKSQPLELFAIKHAWAEERRPCTLRACA